MCIRDRNYNKQIFAPRYSSCSKNWRADCQAFWRSEILAFGFFSSFHSACSRCRFKIIDNDQYALRIISLQKTLLRHLIRASNLSANYRGRFQKRQKCGSLFWWPFRYREGWGRTLANLKRGSRHLRGQRFACEEKQMSISSKSSIFCCLRLSSAGVQPQEGKIRAVIAAC